MTAELISEDDYPTGPIDFHDPDDPIWDDPYYRDERGRFTKKEETMVVSLHGGAVAVSTPTEGVNYHACRVVRLGGRVRVIYADQPGFRDAAPITTGSHRRPRGKR